MSENIDLGGLKPGSVQTFTIPVTAGTQPLRVAVEPISMGTGAESFLSFPREIELKPRQREELSFRLAIPSDALPRAHALGLRFSALPPGATPSPSGQVRVTTAIQLVVRFTVTGISLNLTAADVEAGQTAQLNLIVGNYSPGPLSVQGRVTVTDQGGQSVAQYPLPSTQVPPQKVEAIPLSWPTTPDTMGQFTAQGEVEHKDGLLKAKTSFTVGRLKGKIIGFTVSRATAGEPLRWQIGLQNEGNLTLPVKVENQLSHRGGKAFYREEKTFQVPPLESAAFSFSLPTPRPRFPTSLSSVRQFFLDAQYDLRAEVTHGRQSEALSASTTVSTPYLLKIMGLAALALIPILLATALLLFRRHHP